MGLPEGNRIRDFLEKWYQEVFGKEGLFPLFAIERAHRIPLRAQLMALECIFFQISRQK